MATEIERKFRLHDPDWRRSVDTSRSVHIEQGYLLARDDLSIRVRIADGDASIAVKGATEGLTRAEFEYDIPADDGRELLDLCSGHRIEKRRYRADVDGQAWVIDEFSGANDGLVVAEIELESESAEFQRPSWLGEEVSERPEYYNSNLSRRPYSTWSGTVSD